MQTKVERQHDKEPPETGPYIFPSRAQSPCSSIVVLSLRLVEKQNLSNMYNRSIYIRRRFEHTYPLAFSSPIDICSSNSLTIAFFAAIMEVEEKAAASPLSPMGPMES